MDRFLAGADAEKRERSIALTRDMMRMRAQRHELNNHKPMSIPDTFKFLRDALSAEATRNTFENGAEGQLADTSDVAEADGDGELAKMLAGVDADDVLPALEVQGAAATAEITNLEARLPVAKAELEALWADAHSVQYELVSVFVHGGTGTGGHYWTYQANLPIDGDQFFSYSDDTVKSVGPDEVFADKSASGISPALLCYVRRDRALVDTLHREAAPEETVETVEEQGSGSPRKKGAFGTAQDPLLLL
jgi:ubiquitin carboxyl-terminal hydrolase 25/28